MVTVFAVYLSCFSPSRAPPIQDFTYGKLVLGGGSSCLDSVNGFHNSVVEIRECGAGESDPADPQVFYIS